jgi:hypothetical protein
MFTIEKWYKNNKKLSNGIYDDIKICLEDGHDYSDIENDEYNNVFGLGSEYMDTVRADQHRRK